jgi:flagellar hook-basal body complex protein FliE
MVEDLLAKVNAEQVQAGQAVRELALGQTDNLHGVLLTVAKADLSFRLCLEIRNRLTDALQEIMRMQV